MAFTLQVKMLTMLQVAALIDRKSVVQGKSVDLGGRRIIKKKKKEKNEAVDIIEDINNELENMNKQFEKLKEANYKFYKEDNVYSMIDLIFDGKECEISYSIPHISEQDQKKFYEYVKEYMFKVAEFIKINVSIEKCKKDLKAEKYSIEEIIIEEMYERSE